MYEQLKNEFMLQLVESTDMSDVQIKEIIRHLDIVAYDYNVSRKETSIVVYNQELPYLAKIFIVSKKVEGFSDGTLYNYTRYLNLFFFAVQKSPEQVCANDIRVYLYKYQEERKISNRSLNKGRDCLASFYKWMYVEGYIEKDPMIAIKQIKYEKKERKPITQIELEYLRRSCETKKQVAILEVLYSTGCRVGELAILKKSDIDWHEKTVHLFGKGRKHRVSFLNAKAEVALKEYLASRKDDNEYLFVSDRKPYNQMHASGIQKIIREMAERSGSGVQNKVTPHVIRHTTATRMYENNTDIGTIQSVLGHSNINTTMIYAHNSFDNIKSAHKKSVV